MRVVTLLPAATEIVAALGGVAADTLRRLAPDLLITQDLCELCAIARWRSDAG